MEDLSLLTLDDTKISDIFNTANIHINSFENGDITSPEIDDKLLIVNGLFCGPAVRNHLLKEACESFKKKDDLNGIYYQTEALCFGIRSKYKLKLENEDTNLDSLINELFDKTTEKDFLNVNPLDQYEKIINSEKSIPKANYNPDIGMQNMIRDCLKFPKEWTIVQLCKEFNPEACMSLRESLTTSHSNINITCFSYPRCELYDNKPININLKIVHSANDNIFQRYFDIVQDIKIKSTFGKPDNTKENRVHFWNGMEEMNTSLTNIICELKKTIGPWICLFYGKASTAQDITNEKKIFKEIDEFCKKKYTSRQIILLSLIARCLNTLCEEHINEAAMYIAESALQYKNMIHFFTRLKLSYNAFQNCLYPMILIVDELLDSFPWEMLVPIQEMCRMSSFQILCNIFKKYKENIFNGYLNVKADTGQCLLNPDGNLNEMEARMLKFFNYCLPNWKCLNGKSKEIENLADTITEANVYVYCGHGSGLQYIKCEKLTNLHLKNVVFLFGCESVALSSYGLYSEMTGSHLYYHLALCPMIVGTIFVVTDFSIDMVATQILSTWLKTNTKNPWSSINKTAWRNGEISFKNDKKTDDSLKILAEPNILKLLSLIRSDQNHAIRIRASLVCRGLPILNLCNEINL